MSLRWRVEPRRWPGGPLARLLIALGSNLADPAAALQLGWRCAVDALRLRRPQLSRIYRSAPAEGALGDDFANAVGVGYTNRSPEWVLAHLQRIETAFGRDRAYEAAGHRRPLDLDLLDQDGRRLDRPDLQLPHPRLGHREFVLRPLLEIAPDFVDARLGERASDLLARLPGSAGGQPLSLGGRRW